MVSRDYYEVLSLTLDASSADIKASFRRLAKLHHPDKTTSPTLNDVRKDYNGYTKYLAIEEAYRVLSNVELRRHYDTSRRDAQKSHTIAVRIDLEDMEINEDSSGYTFACRCGDTYCLTEHLVTTSSSDQLVIPCSSCSFAVVVNIRS